MLRTFGLGALGAIRRAVAVRFTPTLPVRVTVILLVGLLLGLWTRNAAAYFENSEVGSYARGMGNNFVAVASDVTALYWNPAGIVRLSRNQALLAVEYVPDLEGVNHSFVGVAYHTSPVSIGLGWNRVTLVNALSEDLAYLSVSRTLVQRALGSFISAGATLKIAHVGLNLDGLGNVPGLRSDQTEIAVDLGFLISPIPNVRAGLVVRNIGRPQFDLIEGFEKTALQNETEFGLSFRWREDATFHFSRVRHAGLKSLTKLGSEMLVGSNVSLRFGVARDLVAAGLGLDMGRWQFDSAFESNDTLGLLSSFTLRYAFGEERRGLGGDFDDF